MVYYFKRYKPTFKGTILAFLIGCVITGVVQKFVIQSSIVLAGNMDIFFINSFGLPFFSGFAFCFVFYFGLFLFGLRIAEKRNWNFFKIRTLVKYVYVDGIFYLLHNAY